MINDTGSGSVSSTEEEPPDIRRVHVGPSKSSLKRKEYRESSEDSIETRIHNDPTFDSSDVEDGSPTSTGNPRCKKTAKKHVVMDTTFQEVFGEDLRRVDSADTGDTGDTGNTFYSQWEHQQNHTLYISLFATFGAVIRIYMGRLFGLDCEKVITEIDDFLTPIASEICLTASGKTDQTGGAFFSDLPANILGSFFIGVLSPVVASGHPIPWFRKDHQLQHHVAFHTALKVGLCGCLTTFASWNTQMVVMMDGSGTELGSQVAPAFFGYLLGICCSVTSFIVGRHVHDWLKDSRSPVTELGTSGHVIQEASIHSTASNASRAAYCFWRQAVVILGIDVAPFLIFVGLAVAFGVADGVLGIPFYRRMWMIILISPFGALLRWRMSRWNNLKPGGKRLAWIPWGTFLANVIAAIISVMAEALEARHNPKDHVNYIWYSSALIAVEAGFAGSLSTVSTLVKEMFVLASKNPSRAYIYFLFTVLCSMLLSLAVYIPMMRI